MRFGNIKLPKRCMDVYDNPMKSMQLVQMMKDVSNALDGAWQPTKVLPKAPFF